MSRRSGTDRRLALRTLVGIVAVPWTLAPRGAKAAAFAGPQPIRLIVPFPAGGSTDVVARLFALGLGQQLKTTVYVENIAGATGTVGLLRAARAEPDGRTLALGISATHAIAPTLLPDLPYKPDRDFVPIGRLAQTGLIVVAHPAFPANDIAELLALARKPGADLMYGSWGNASGGHLMMEAIGRHAGARLTQVPYMGEAPLLQALIGGEVMLAAASVGTAMPNLRAGKLKVLAIGSPSRAALLPEVPTLLEQGVPFAATSWYGLFAPAPTPGAIVDELARATAAVLVLPAFTDKARALGLDVQPVSREAFVRQIRDDTATWGRLIQAGGIKAD
jgi:tripartite-type tricarboxylate transporter receptor subunit TctC